MMSIIDSNVETKHNDCFHPQRKGGGKPKQNQRRKQNRLQINYKNKLKLIKAKTNNETLVDFNPFNDIAYQPKAASNSSGHHDHWDYGKNMTYANVFAKNKDKEATKDQWKILRNINPPSSTTDFHIPTDGFFCDSPSKSTHDCLLEFMCIHHILRFPLLQTMNMHILLWSVSTTIWPNHCSRSMHWWPFVTWKSNWRTQMDTLTSVNWISRQKDAAVHGRCQTT